MSPLGRGTDALIRPGVCRGFWGEAKGVLSSSNVTQFEWFVEHMAEEFMMQKTDLFVLRSVLQSSPKLKDASCRFRS